MKKLMVTAMAAFSLVAALAFVGCGTAAESAAPVSAEDITEWTESPQVEEYVRQLVIDNEKGEFVSYQVMENGKGQTMLVVVTLSPNGREYKSAFDTEGNVLESSYECPLLDPEPQDEQ